MPRAAASGGRVPFSGMFEEEARELRRSEKGGWERAASDLYPPPVALGPRVHRHRSGRLDPVRAARELTTIFKHQWVSGKVPHIFFHPDAPPGSYFPGVDHRVTALSPLPTTRPGPPPSPSTGWRTASDAWNERTQARIERPRRKERSPHQLGPMGR